MCSLCHELVFNRRRELTHNIPIEIFKFELFTADRHEGGRIVELDADTELSSAIAKLFECSKLHR